jgi:hypothetical protein
MTVFPSEALDVRDIPAEALRARATAALHALAKEAREAACTIEIGDIPTGADLSQAFASAIVELIAFTASYAAEEARGE